MRYFIVHSGKDYDIVKKVVDILREKASQNDYDVFSERVDNWQDTAKERISKSDAIIFFVNKTTHLNENIEYELQHAIDNNKKVFVYKLSKRCRISYKMAKILNCDIKLSRTKAFNLRIYSSVRRLIKALEQVRNSVNLEVDLCNNISSNNRDFFEQYLMFVKTSEDLVKRKQNLNNLYITLNSAILGIIAAIASWKLSEGELLNFSIGALAFDITIKRAAMVGVAFFGVLICFSWRRILKIYDNLNSSKMSVIIEIEKKLPLNLFAKEWQCIVDRDSRRRYRSFSKSERFTAIIFLVFYIVVMIFGIIIMVV